MKNKKLLIVVTAVLLVAVSVFAIVGLVRSSRIKTFMAEQNYVASKLIELGDYDVGFELAAQTEQQKSNAVSRQLIVLSAGFDAEYEEAISYAEYYLADSADPIISEVKRLMESELENMPETVQSTGWNSTYTEYTLSDDMRVELMSVLIRVQDSINVKKSGANIQAMIELLSSSGSQSTAAVQTLSSDNSLLSKKIRTVLKLEQNDNEGAYELAKELFEADDSFANRALIANLVASGVGDTNLSDDKTLTKLDSQRTELYTKLGELESELYVTDNEKKKTRLEQQISEVEAKIDEVDNEIAAEPVKRAINFIEQKTSVSDKNSDAYGIELAYLNYLAGNESDARQLLVGVFANETDDPEPVSVMASDISKVYQNGGSGRDIQMTRLWERICNVLNLLESNKTVRDTNFYEFLKNTLEQLYNSLVIRDIDASEFPTVRVTLNVADNTDTELKKDDFSIDDMDVRIKKLKLVNPEKSDERDELSIILAIDRSGSMEGDSMTNTKKAVLDFIRSIDDEIDVGLVSFDNSAEVLTPVGGERINLTSNVQSLYASGGTSIYSGLKAAGDELTGRTGRKVIILLSDGYDGSGNMIDTVLEELRLKNIYVYTIGITGADDEYLSYIANYCGGKFLRADDSSLLSEIYASIGEYMANDYILEFEATEDLDNFKRHLRVTTDALSSTTYSEYNVGVSAEEIADEEQLTPLYGCFRQLGGSAS